MNGFIDILALAGIPATGFKTFIQIVFNKPLAMTPKESKKIKFLIIRVTFT